MQADMAKSGPNPIQAAKSGIAKGTQQLGGGTQRLGAGTQKLGTKKVGGGTQPKQAASSAFGKAQASAKQVRPGTDLTVSAVYLDIPPNSGLKCQGSKSGSLGSLFLEGMVPSQANQP